MDFLDERREPLGNRVDLLGQLRVLLQKVGLELRELVAVRRRRSLIGSVGPRLRLLGDDQVTPAALGRRRATQPTLVRPTGRQGHGESARRQPENQPDTPDVTTRQQSR